jgi:hypothetical protein
MPLLPIQFSLNAVLILVIGVVFLAGGLYAIRIPYMRFLGVGLLATAFGCICCGLTDGFSDPTPRGTLLRRLGAGGFIIGVPILIYTVYGML